jgi:transposase
MVQRARIVLMLAEGLTNAEIVRRTGSTRPTVISWRNRYATGGINALGDLPRPGRPPVVDELDVVATTLADGGRPPAHLGVSQWSSRLLGHHLGISFATVARIWRKWGIEPRHVEMLPRPISASGAEGQPADQSDPRLKLIEISLGIIAQQIIRCGNFAAVGNLIDALGALIDGWHHELSHRPTASEKPADTITGNDSPSGPDELASRARNSRSVRAELHGSRGRRSGPRSGAGR